MRSFISHFRRFNKVAGTMGPTRACTNSIIWGCSLSLHATAALSTVWLRAQEAEVPAVLCNSIVDDRRLCTTGRTAPEQLRSAIQVARDFDSAAGTRFNPLKSTSATPARRMEAEVRMASDHFGMEMVTFEKQLGYPVTYKGRRTNQSKRADAAARTVTLISRLPVARPRLIETDAIPRFQFAIECGVPLRRSWTPCGQRELTWYRRRWCCRCR